MLQQTVNSEAGGCAAKAPAPEILFISVRLGPRALRKTLAPTKCTYCVICIKQLCRKISLVVEPPPPFTHIVTQTVALRVVSNIVFFCKRYGSSPYICVKV